MPTYVFRCAEHGPFDGRAPITAVPDDAPCPACGARAPRGISAPALGGGAGAHRIAAAHERSAHAPGVVTSVPSGAPSNGAARRTSTDPRHARLPRP